MIKNHCVRVLTVTAAAEKQNGAFKWIAVATGDGCSARNCPQQQVVGGCTYISYGKGRGGKGFICKIRTKCCLGDQEWTGNQLALLKWT